MGIFDLGDLSLFKDFFPGMGTVFSPTSLTILSPTKPQTVDTDR